MKQQETVKSNVQIAREYKMKELISTNNKQTMNIFTAIYRWLFKRCVHDFEHVSDTNYFANEYDKMPYKKTRTYICSRCLEVKVVKV